MKKDTKKGLIVYNPNEAVKNRAFIDMFTDKGKNYNLDISLCLKNDFKDRLYDNILFCINRTRDLNISKICEDNNISAYNSSFVTALANNKYKTIEFFRDYFNKHDIKLSYDIFPDTCFLSCEEYENNKLNLCEYLKEKKGFIHFDKPPVIKSVSGHGGKEVFLLDDKYDYQHISFPDGCIIQRFIESNACDIRVYVLNNKIYSCILRQGKDSFKSNFSLGGKIKKYEPDTDNINIISHFINAFSLEKYGFVGIDFLIDSDKRIYFNEVEEMAGTRMLYSLTDKDIVEDLLYHISCSLD